MKKVVLVLALTAFIASGAFAQLSFSAGVGAFFDGSFGNGVKMTLGSKWSEQGNDIISFGGFLFFDASFAEASVSFGYNSIAAEYKRDSDGNKASEALDPDEGFLAMGLSFLGKFPLNMGALTFYPAIGIEYNIVLAHFRGGDKVDYGDESVTEWFSQFGILAGVGIDLPLSSAMYLRAQALFNLRFPNKFVKDYAESYNEYLSVLSGSAAATLGIGPKIKVGIGFRL